MPSALERLDQWLLDLVEGACRRWQRLTGRTNVWLAVQLTNLSIAVYFVWAGVEIWTNDWGIRSVLAVFAALVLYGLTKTVLRVPIEAAEASAFRRVMQGLRNPRRLRDVAIRLPFLGLSVLLAGPSLVAWRWLGIRPFGYGLVLLTTALMYVLACDPLPPSPATERRRWPSVLARLLRGPSAQPAEGG